jgi:hypothetical protein
MRRAAMANFLLIFTDGMEPTEEESAGVIQEWTNWFSGLGENLVDAGNPITPASKNISSDGAVKDGPVGVAATGYAIIKADGLDAAVEAAKSCPHLKSGGEITVYETFPVS